MIQSTGLHIDAERARAVSLGRDLRIWASAETPVVNTSEIQTESGSPGSPAAVSVPAVEWIRAATYAIQETYLALPVKARRVWGIALSAPGGWVALDFDYRPVNDVRVTGSERALEDFASWRASNGPVAARLATVLSPRDYLRFAISGALATDTTEVDRLGLLDEGRAQWSARAEEAGLERRWRPPVFDSHVPTGRLSEDGVRRSGLPGGTWVIAGAHEDAAAALGVADLRREVLWKIVWPGRSPRLVRGVPDGSDAVLPEPWVGRRSAIEGFGVFERELSGEADEDAAREALDVTSAAGLPAEEVIEVEADPALGAAALAAVGSGLIKGWDRYYAALED